MKYFRVKKDTFMWKEGAVLHDQGIAQYVALEDIWDAVPTVGAEYISGRIIEHLDNAAFFERVYPESLAGKAFRTKDQLVAAVRKGFSSE